MMAEASLEMEYLTKRNANWTVIGIHRHDVPHVRPPPAAHRCLGDCIPARLILDLDVSEQTPITIVEEDRIASHAMLHQHIVQLFPDWRVASLVLFVLAGMHGHAERLANHSDYFLT